MRILLFFALPVLSFGQTYQELRNHLIQEEGYTLKPYSLRGRLHVGIGHRIIGIPKKSYTRNEVENFFERDLHAACRAAYSNIKNFSQHPKEIRVMMCALAYNVGPSGFANFVSFRKHIERFDYGSAANELNASLWSKQLPNRSYRYVNILKKYNR